MPGAVDLLALLSRAVHEALGFYRLQTEGDAEDSYTGVTTVQEMEALPDTSCPNEADFVEL